MGVAARLAVGKEREPHVKKEMMRSPEGKKAL